MAKRHRNAFRLRDGAGFFDESSQNAELSRLGDPLVRLKSEVNWEMFRPVLSVLYAGERKSKAGRRPIDPVLMFKILILQRLYNLSDDQTEYQIRDRSSFQRFLGIHVGDGSPDAKTIWKFREQVRTSNLERELFFRFDEHLASKGFAAKGGQIIDATIVEAPRQRNTFEENALIAEGTMPPQWDGQNHKIAQKDMDARWTQKGGQRYYGYKSHINIDQEHKFIRDYTITDAAIHDSRMFEDILNSTDPDRPAYADSAYRSETCEASLKERGIESQIHERAHRNRLLTEAMKAANKEKSRVRVRVEHVFGFIHTSLRGGGFVRTIGSHRAQIHIALTNLTYNLSRYVMLISHRWPAAA